MNGNRTLIDSTARWESGNSANLVRLRIRRHPGLQANVYTMETMCPKRGLIMTSAHLSDSTLCGSKNPAETLTFTTTLLAGMLTGMLKPTQVTGSDCEIAA